MESSEPEGYEPYAWMGKGGKDSGQFLEKETTALAKAPPSGLAWRWRWRRCQRLWLRARNALFETPPSIPQWHIGEGGSGQSVAIRVGCLASGRGLVCSWFPALRKGVGDRGPLPLSR